MSLQIVLIASGAIAACFGALFFVAADTAIRTFELGASDVASRLFARSTGAGLIAIAVINVIASQDAGSGALYAIVIGNLLLHVLAIAVDFTEKFPRKGGWWVGFAVHIVLILAFGYYAIWWPGAAVPAA
ncbi:MAG TPA: hypothetical protein VFB16_04185 [Bauldia sp.]|nr:hypothetical protein [Bauldia sp.]